MYFKLIFVYFLFLGVLGLFTYGRAHLVNVSSAFDILIILSLFIYKPKFKDRKAMYLCLAFLFYFFSSLLIAIFLRKVHILDFLLAYKAIFYLIILFYFCNKKIGSLNSFNNIYFILLALFFIKYILSIVLGLNDRPLLFRENNFELMFLALVFYLRCISTTKIQLFELIAILSIFIASGSKSALPILLFVLASYYLRSLTWKNMLAVTILGTIVTSFFVFIMLSKYGISGLSSIDRLAFLRVFIIEMQNSSVMEILFGHPRLSPLMVSSCNALYFYPGLFSYKGDGSCYSLILHSFILRSLFDHGVIATVLIFYSSYFLLIKAGFNRRDGYTFMGVLFLNSLSVSGYNSVFFALSMIFYIGFSPKNTKMYTR